MAEILGIASGLILLAGAPFYLVDIFKGVTKPERTTWLVWSFLGIIAFASQVKLGGHWSLVYVGLEAAGNIIVYSLALKFGVGGWKRQDKIAMVVAIAGVLISLLMHSPLAALWGVVIADFAGAALTIQKAFLQPKSETTITWLALGLSSFLASFAVGKTSLQLLLYPVYFTAVTWAVPVAQVFGSRRLLPPETSEI